MTTPMTPPPTPEPWDDDRLAAAFAARASHARATQPPGLVGVTVAAVRATAATPARSVWRRLLPAAAVVLIAAAGVATILSGGANRNGADPTGPISAGPSNAAADAPRLRDLPVRTVADLIEAAATQPTPEEVVVRGWLARPSADVDCWAPKLHPLIPDCEEGLLFLHDGRPSGIYPPVDPNLVPMIGVDAHVEVEAPRGGTVEVVAIGHQSDHRWMTCPADQQAACRARFVIDRILPAGATPDDDLPTPWSVIEATPSSIGGTPAADPTEAVAALTDAIGDVTVVSIGTVDTDTLPTIEPIIDGQRGPADRVWVVRALTGYPGPAIARTFLLNDAALARGEPSITEVTKTDVVPIGGPAAEVPTKILGLPVLTVTDAIANRDAGVDDQEIAVRGWFAGIPAVRCLASIELLTSPVQPVCPDEFVWLTEERGAVTGIDAMPPSGPAIHPDLDDLDLAWLVGGPDLGPATPVQIVVVGHFDDRRSAACPADLVQACRDRFVVDRVDWVDGGTLPRSELDLFDGDEASRVGDILKHLDAETPGSPVLSVVVVDGPTGIGRIEPSLGTGRGGFIDQRAIWVIRVLEGDRAVTYLVIDGTDSIFQMAADGEAVAVGGTLPAPSADASWPPEGATVIELTSEVGEGRPPARVAIVDPAGWLASVREVRPDDPGLLDTVGAPKAALFDDPGHGGRFRLVWAGGVCDGDMTVALERSARRIVVDKGLQPPCDAMGVLRELVLEFSEAVDPGSIDVFYTETRSDQP